MKKTILAVLFAIGFFSVQAGEMIPLGSNAEKLDVKTWIHQKPVELSQFKGKKPVVLFFWTLDSASIMAFKPLSELISQIGDEKAAWIGIAVSDDKKIAEFQLTKSLPFPVALDSGKTVKKYMPSGLKYPACAIISGDGRLVWRGTVRGMPIVLKRLLAGKLDINEIARKEKFNISLSRAVKEKKYKEAVKLIESEQKLKFSPDLTKLHLRMLLDSKDTTGATAMLDKTISEHPEYIGPHLLRQMLYRSYFKDIRKAQISGMDSIEKLKKHPMVLADLLKSEMQLSNDQRSPEFMFAIADALKSSMSNIKAPKERAVLLYIYAQAMNMCAFNEAAVAAAEEAEKLFTDERSKKSAKIQKEYYQKLIQLKKKQMLKK